MVFFHEFADPVKLSVTEGCTIQHLIQAQTQLVGDLQVSHAFDHLGNALLFSHVLQLGQVVVVQCEDGSCLSGDALRDVFRSP